MSNPFSLFFKKTVLGTKNNLVSLDEPYQAFARLLKNFQITGIIDAGASNGRISKKLIHNFPKAHVYGFEPNSLYVNTLFQYAKEDSRFSPCFVALSDHEGTADLQKTASPGSTSLYTPGEQLKKLDPIGTSVKKTEKVEVTTIDQWVILNGNPAIQLMKFDIQGGELKALQGATRTLKNSTLLIYIEILFNPLYSGGAIYSDIDLFLRKYGFVLYDIYKPKYNSNGLLLWGNAIYLHADKTGM